MAMVGKETIDDVDIDEDQLNPDPADAMKPAEDENGQAVPTTGEEKPKSGTKPEAANGENGETAKDGEEEDEAPAMPRLVLLPPPLVPDPPPLRLRPLYMGGAVRVCCEWSCWVRF